jgi:hypothetical protein
MTVADSPPEMIAADERDPRIQAALSELRGTVLSRFPGATFSMSHGEDPEGIYLKPEVDVEDLDDVADVIAGRLLDMQVWEGLPIYVIPVWPEHRIAEYLRHQKSGALTDMPTMLTS